MTKHPHIPDRPERASVHLAALRRDRPTKPASEFSEAMASKLAAHNLPHQTAWQARAGVERAAELMRQARALFGASQEDFARAAHTSQSIISDIERGAGKVGPSFGVFFRILSAHGLDLKVVRHSQAPSERKEAVG